MNIFSILSVLIAFLGAAFLTWILLSAFRALEKKIHTVYENLLEEINGSSDLAQQSWESQLDLAIARISEIYDLLEETKPTASIPTVQAGDRNHPNEPVAYQLITTQDVEMGKIRERLDELASIIATMDDDFLKLHNKLEKKVKKIDRRVKEIETDLYSPPNIVDVE